MFYGFKCDLEAKSHILGKQKAQNAIKHMEHDSYWAPGDVERRKIGEPSSIRERGIGTRASTRIPTQVQKS
jgi:hypothetical protein